MTLRDLISTACTLSWPLPRGFPKPFFPTRSDIITDFKGGNPARVFVIVILACTKRRPRSNQVPPAYSGTDRASRALGPSAFGHFGPMKRPQTRPANEDGKSKCRGRRRSISIEPGRYAIYLAPKTETVLRGHEKSLSIRPPSVCEEKADPARTRTDRVEAARQSRLARNREHLLRRKPSTAKLKCSVKTERERECVRRTNTEQ